MAKLGSNEMKELLDISFGDRAWSVFAVFPGPTNEVRNVLTITLDCLWFNLGLEVDFESCK